MNFVQWLNSLDELLYELMSWIVFFPVTLWRILRHPLRTMDYAEAQLSLPPDEQYRATVSPPILLILALMLCQAIELAFTGTNPIVTSRHGLASLVDDNTTLLLLRLVLFGMFPLILATRMVRQSDRDLTRDTLKPPFYAQCYAVTPFAVLLSIGSTALVQHHFPAVQIAGLGVLTIAFLFYGIVQVRWFSHQLNRTAVSSFLHASLGMIESIFFAAVIAYLFAL